MTIQLSGWALNIYDWW